jgi:predicted PurR-regulated permease PerM
MSNQTFKKDPANRGNNDKNELFEALKPIWLGRRDSNPRMPGPKPGALPLGHAPLLSCGSATQINLSIVPTTGLLGKAASWRGCQVVKHYQVVYCADMRRPTQTISIETDTIVRVLMLITVFVAGIWLITKLEHELVWIGIAFFLAVALDPAVSGIAKLFRCGRLIATGIVSVVFVVLLGLLGASLLPPLVSQSQALVRELPSYLKQAENSHGTVGHIIHDYNLVARAKDLQSHLLSDITSATGTEVGVVLSVFNGLAALVTIFVLTFFMLLEGPRWVTWSGRQVPRGEQSQYHRITARMYKIVSGYVTGNLIIAAIMAVLTSVAIDLVGVPFAIPLGILSGLATLIPMIGGFLAMIVVCSVAVFTSVTAAIILLIYFGFYLVIDAHVLRPIVYSRTVQMSSLLVVIAIVLGTALDGVIGALVAIPVVACIGVVVTELMGDTKHPTPKA